MKLSLLSVKAFENISSRNSLTGARTEKGCTPKMAIVSLVKWIEKHGYTQDDYDFYDLDMLLPSDEQIREYFQDYQPNVVGISAILSSTFGEVQRVSKIARETCPNAWIIMGGHASAASNTVLRKSEIDICIAGDGENPLLEFLDYVKKNGRNWDFNALQKIKGLCFIDSNDETQFTGWPLGVSADELVLPDYDLLRRGLKDQPELIENYFKDSLSDIAEKDPRYQSIKGPRKTASLPTAKGCVAKCSFCQRATKGYRALTIDKIEDHLIYLKKTFNVTDIDITDENFGSDVKQAYQFAALMKKHNMFWVASGVRVSTFSSENIKFLRDNNCLYLRFGLEAGSDRALGIMDKKITTKQIQKSFQHCVDAELITEMTIWLLGNPGDSNETAIETGRTIGKLAHILGVPPSLSSGTFCYVMPVPGTPLYEYAQKVGVIPKDPDGEEKYLHHMAKMRNTSKANYCNVNGAPKKEWHFWDILIRLEASRTYRNLCKETPIKSSFISRAIMERAKTRGIYKFDFNNIINLFSWAVGNPLVDALPRNIIYPLLSNLNYFVNVILKDFIRRITGNLDKRAFPGKAEKRLKIEMRGKKYLRAASLRRLLKDNNVDNNEFNESLVILSKGQ